jgi:dolichol-phosphate mannosyltransferase
MPVLVAHARRGELPPLVNPETARDFVYVEDACEAFLLAARTPAPAPSGSAIYNLGSGKQTTLRQLVEVARRALGIAAEPDWGSYEQRAWDTDVWVADPGKINRELGWSARTDLDTGLSALASWFDEHTELAERYAVAP